MERGTLKWEEFIVRGIEPEELPSVFEELIEQTETGRLVIEAEIDGTYSMSYKNLIQSWKDM